MGNGTFAVGVENYSPVDAAAGLAVHGGFTFSSSYATGGDVITAAMCGLGEISQVNVKGPAFGVVSGTNQAIVVRYIAAAEGQTSGLMAAFWEQPGGSSQGPLVEVPAGTNLSAFSCPIIVYGK